MKDFNYINKHTIMGMLSRNYIPFDNWKGFYKNKKRTKIVVFDKINGDFEEINYSYMNNREKGSYKSTMLISYFDDNFFNLEGKLFREIRETRNKWNKKIIVKKNPHSIEETIDLINRWDKSSGKKYRFNRHSGYDRNFFNKYWESEKENLFSLFFYFGNNLVGYSIVSKINNGCFCYIIRKVDITVGRNICLYVDYKTFENIHNFHSKFYINWGASSGNVLKYKKKFPINKEINVYFFKRKKV
jgi:hypothetical protein